MNQAAHQLATAMANGGDHIGDLVWPEIRLGKESIKRETLAQYLDEAGLPEGWAPTQPSGQKAFGRALSFCRNLEAAPNVSIERESLRSRVALVRHHTGEGLAKKTRTWARVVVSDEVVDGFTRLRDEWSEDADIRDLMMGIGSDFTAFLDVRTAITRLKDECERHQRFTDSQELGVMVTKVIQAHLGGIRIRRDGGLYFVPTKNGDALRAFAGVMKRIGDSRVAFLPAFDTPEGRESIGHSVSDTLHGEVNRVLDGLKRLGSEAKGPRESSLRRRLDELDALNARAETCRILLADYSTGIASAVRGAREQVLGLMDIDATQEDE